MVAQASARAGSPAGGGGSRQRPATAPARAGGLRAGAGARARACRRVGYRQVEALAAARKRGPIGASAGERSSWMEIDRRRAAVGATGRDRGACWPPADGTLADDMPWLRAARADPAVPARDRSGSAARSSRLRPAGETIGATRFGSARHGSARPPVHHGAGGSLRITLASGPSIRLFPPIAGGRVTPSPAAPAVASVVSSCSRRSLRSSARPCPGASRSRPRSAVSGRY